MTTFQISAEQRSLLAAGALAKDLPSSPRLLTTLLDEEIIALTGPEAPGERWPWLDGLRRRVPDYDLDEAVLTGARILRARGITAPEATLAKIEDREILGDGTAVRASLVVTGILTRRAAFRHRVSVSRESVAAELTVVFYTDSDGSVLQEQISPDGLHHFLIQDTPSARRAMKSLLLNLGEENPGNWGDQHIISGSWDALASTLGLPEHSASQRIELTDAHDGSSETMWCSASSRGPVLLRTLEHEQDMRLTDTQLEAVQLTPRNFDELVQQMFTLTRAQE